MQAEYASYIRKLQQLENLTIEIANDIVADDWGRADAAREGLPFDADPWHRDAEYLVQRLKAIATEIVLARSRVRFMSAREMDLASRPEAFRA